MIARIWHGATDETFAGEYLAYLEATGLKDYRATEGNRGVYVLRRVADGRADFLLVSFWESFDAVRRFADPDDPEAAVYYPEDRRYLLELEPRVVHYEAFVSAADVERAMLGNEEARTPAR